MRSNPLLSFLLVLGLGLSAQARAESLTWEQALSICAQSNTDLRSSEEALKQARLSVVRTEAAFLPKASASAGLNQSGPYDINGGFGDGSGSGSASLSGSLNLFNGFADLAARSKAKAALDSALAAQQTTRAQVGYQLRAAFLTLLQAQEAEAQALTIAARRTDNVDLVQLRYQAGRENQGALLQTQALAAQSAWQARRASRSRRSAALSLAQLLGRDSGDGLVAQGELVAPEAPVDEIPADALKGLPSLRQAQDSLISAQQDVRAAASSWWPSLGASASVGRSGGPWLSDSGSWSAGLSLSLPIFQGGTRVVDQLSAASRLRDAELSLADAKRQALSTLRGSLDAYLNGAEQAGVEELFYQASLVRAEVARAQYTQGLLTFDLWDQNETDLINAQTSALSSLGDAQRAAAAWQRDLGRSPLP